MDDRARQITDWHERLPHLIQVLDHYSQKHDADILPFMRSVLLQFTEHAKAELGDLPRRADWDFDRAEGPAGIGDLQSFLNACDHKNAPRWRAAADLLRWCLMGLHRPDLFNQRNIRRIQTCAMAFDAEVGRKRRKEQSEFGRRGKSGDALEMNAYVFQKRYKQLTAANPRKSKFQCEVEIAKEFNVSRSTVRRRLSEGIE